MHAHDKRPKYSDIFDEVKKIRAINKDQKDQKIDADNKDFIFAGLCNELDEVLFLDDEFNALLIQQFPVPEDYDIKLHALFRIFLNAIFTSATGCGNCENQASLGLCKILLQGEIEDEERVELFGFAGKGRLILKAKEMKDEPNDHAAILYGHNHDSYRREGMLFDTWSRDKIVANEGLTAIVKSTGITEMTSFHSSFNTYRNLNPKEWSQLASFLAFIKNFLNQKKFLELIPKLKANIENNLKKHFREDAAAKLLKLVEAYKPDDNFLKLIHDEIDKWVILCKAKCAAVFQEQHSSAPLFADSTDSQEQTPAGKLRAPAKKPF